VYWGFLGVLVGLGVVWDLGFGWGLGVSCGFGVCYLSWLVGVL